MFNRLEAHKSLLGGGLNTALRMKKINPLDELNESTALDA